MIFIQDLKDIKVLMYYTHRVMIHLDCKQNNPEEVTERQWKSINL